MKRKGVSQIIGIILLMAISIAIVSVLAGWAPSLAGDITEGAAENVQTDIQCDDASFRINEAVWLKEFERAEAEVENVGSQRFSEGLELAIIIDASIEHTENIGSLDPGGQTSVEVEAIDENPEAVQVSSIECPELTEDKEVTEY